MAAEADEIIIQAAVPHARGLSMGVDIDQRISLIAGLQIGLHLHLLGRLGFNGPRDLHRNGRDIGDSGGFHPPELAVLGGRHGAGNARCGLDKLSSFHLIDSRLGCECVGIVFLSEYSYIAPRRWLSASWPSPAPGPRP